MSYLCVYFFGGIQNLGCRIIRYLRVHKVQDKNEGERSRSDGSKKSKRYKKKKRKKDESFIAHYNVDKKVSLI